MLVGMRTFLMFRLWFLQTILMSYGVVIACTECEYHYCVDDDQKITLKEERCDCFGFLSSAAYSVEKNKLYQLGMAEKQEGLDFSCSCIRPNGACTCCLPHDPSCAFKGVDGVSVAATPDQPSSGKDNENKALLAEGNVILLFQLLRPLSQHFICSRASGGPSLRAPKQVIDKTMRRLTEVSERAYLVFMPSAVVAHSVKSIPKFTPLTSILTPQVISGQDGVKRAITFNVDFQGVSERSAGGVPHSRVTGEYRIDLAEGITSTTLNFSDSEQRKILGDLNEHKKLACQSKDDRKIQ